MHQSKGHKSERFYLNSGLAHKLLCTLAFSFPLTEPLYKVVFFGPDTLTAQFYQFSSVVNTLLYCLSYRSNIHEK